MSAKVTGTKYQELADKVTNIYLESGFSKSTNTYESWGYNQFYKDEEVKFVFYWDSLQEILTPLGLITIPKGSCTGNAMNVAKDNLIEYYGLELIEQKDGLHGERWFYYKPTKNIPE